MKWFKIVGISVVFSCAISVTPLVGCAGEAEVDAAAQTVATVDPRFVTADSIVAHYNSITTRTPVDARAALELFYAENDKQRQLLNIGKSMIPMAELDQLMRERYGEGLDPRKKNSMLKADGPASIASRNGQRAEATLINSDGEHQTLQLVQIGERWWISGYTLEYSPETKQMIADIPDMNRFEKGLTTMGSAARTAIAKIKDGSVSSAQDARRAFTDTVLASPPPR